MDVADPDMKLTVEVAAPTTRILREPIPVQTEVAREDLTKAPSPKRTSLNVTMVFSPDRAC